MHNFGYTAPAMFCGLIAFLLVGFPVAFSLGALGLFFGLIAVELGYFGFEFFTILPMRIFDIMTRDLLLAIPFFTFMGVILERSGLAEDLLEGAGQLFGPIPGGVAYAVVIVGAILGSITGTVAASVIAMGMISLPVMMKYGYDTRFSTGVIAASGTIAQLIPPSLVLIVLADQLRVPLGNMYIGAIFPSLLQVLIFLIFVGVTCFFWPHKAPPLPPEARTFHGWALIWKVVKGVVPSAILMLLVVGTILFGWATPTEAGALGSVGAMFLALVRGKLTKAVLWSSMETTSRLTSMVIFILIGATIFSVVFQGVYGGEWVESMLKNLPGGQLGFLVFVNIFVFFLAFFLDFFEIAFIALPLLYPIAQQLGIDMVWFGVMICVNMQTSFMHPPFGFVLFYLRGVAPKSIKTSDIYLGSIPWIFMQLLLVMIVLFVPSVVTYWAPQHKVMDATQVEQTLDGLGIGGGTGDMPPLELEPLNLE